MLELNGEAVGGFGLRPVLVGEFGGDLGDGFADGALRVGEVWVVVLEVFCCSGVDFPAWY